MTTYAFDVYGTLINPLAIGERLTDQLGAAAPGFARIWREKQLEYSFRRGLMDCYENFSVCTQQALDYTCSFTGHDLDLALRSSLLDEYTRLPAYADIRPALTVLKERGDKLYGFSNGLPSDLESLFAHAGIRDLFDGIISVHDQRSFKPDPAVYTHFNRSSESQADDTWLVSSNPFDVCGARAVGWQAAWVQRDPKAVFDPWEFLPSKVVSSLVDL